jgi:hypothetical protein
MIEITEVHAWKRWALQKGRCQATTTKGEQCRNASRCIGRTVSKPDHFDMVPFIPGETDRCHLHGGKVHARSQY